MKNNSVDITAPLQRSNTFKGKINALIDYLYIGTVECKVRETIKKPILSSKPKYIVRDIRVSSGTPEYLKSYLNTSWKYLELSLKKTLENDQGFYNTRKILMECRSKCAREIERYAVDDRYTFEAIHSFVIVSKEEKYPAFFDNLIFSDHHKTEMTDQCLVRQSFLKRLYAFLDNHLISLINIPDTASNPIGWDSDNKEMEITEFLYALRLIGRINIKGDLSEPQFREKFFNFFGLSDKDYNKRTNEIRRRKNRPLFLKQLVDALESAT
jgi:hypothetical protein